MCVFVKTRLANCLLREVRAFLKEALKIELARFDWHAVGKHCGCRKRSRCPGYQIPAWACFTESQGDDGRERGLDNQAPSFQHPGCNLGCVGREVIMSRPCRLANIFAD